MSETRPEPIGAGAPSATPAIPPTTAPTHPTHATDRPDLVDEADAAAEALSRARAAARAKGLRPGRPGPRRRKDVPRAAPTTGRDPRLLGDQLEEFVVDRGWQEQVSVGAVIGRWPRIVGEDVSAHCHPVEFVDGVLTVRAESTAWATQLRMLASTLLGRLAGEVGEGVVTQVRVVGPSAPSWSRGALRATDGRGPRDTYG